MSVGGGVGQFENQKQPWKHFATLRYVCAVCFIFFLRSFVPCQALAEALQQNSSLTNLNVASNNIGSEGAKAWCLVRMGAEGRGSEERHKRRQGHTVNAGKHFATLAVLHRVSQVTCLLPGSGQSPDTELQSDGSAVAAEQHRP